MSFTSLWYSSGEEQFLSDESGGHNTPEPPTLLGVVMNHQNSTRESNMNTTLASRSNNNNNKTISRAGSRRSREDCMYEDVIPAVDSRSSDPGPDFERYTPLSRRIRSDSPPAPNLEPRAIHQQQLQYKQGRRRSVDEYSVSSPPSTPEKSTETSLTLTPESQSSFNNSSDDLTPFDEDVELGRSGKDRHQRSSRSTAPSPADVSAVRGQAAVGKKTNSRGKVHDDINKKNNRSSTTSTKSPTTNQKRPNYALRKSEREALMKKKKHCSLLAYGKVLTLLAIVFAVTAVVFAFLARRSLSFIRVQEALDISPLMYGVEHVGLLRTQFCYNDTAVEITSKANAAVTADAITIATTIPSPLQHTGCFILDMGVDMIDDTMWNISRTFLSLAILMGMFLVIMLSLAIFWESINLKPVAIGLLVTYFFQSLSFFFFDSELCRENVCKLSEGSTFSIVACLFWFMSGLVCIRMDVVYQSEQRKWARRRKRAIKKLKLQRRFKEMKDATFRTSSTMTEPNSPDQSVGLRKSLAADRAVLSSSLDDVYDQDAAERRNLNDLFDDAEEDLDDLREWYSEDTADLELLSDELFDDLELKLSDDLDLDDIELDEPIDHGVSKELFHI